MRKIGKTSTGNMLIEITPEEWKRLALHMIIPEDMSEALKKYRKEHGLSQVAFAKKLGVSRGYIYELERCTTPINTGLEKYRRIISLIF